MIEFEPTEINLNSIGDISITDMYPKYLKVLVFVDYTKKTVDKNELFGSILDSIEVAKVRTSDCSLPIIVVNIDLLEGVIIEDKIKEFISSELDVLSYDSTWKNDGKLIVQKKEGG